MEKEKLLPVVQSNLFVQLHLFYIHQHVNISLFNILCVFDKIIVELAPDFLLRDRKETAYMCKRQDGFRADV